MAKVNEAPTGPDHLRMDLFAPGMTLLHRAGLGGLACTLKAIERQLEGGLLRKEKLPAPFVDGGPPWEIDERSVTLRFGKPDAAAGYLQRLFEFAFQIRDGLIFLPGQYELPPNPAARADLQAGLTLTFLQHGKVRQLEKTPTTATYSPEVEGQPGVVVEFKRCSGFKHQQMHETLLDKNELLTSEPLKIDGPVNPGAVVRHVAFTGDTAAEEPPERMLPLYFALVGCLALPVNRGVAALLVPEVDDLLEFILDRPAMTPTTARDCQIAGSADAALQAYVRLRSVRLLSGAAMRSCYAMTFRPTPWASQQKSRVATVHVEKADGRLMDRFARVLALLPPRIAVRTVKETTGRGKTKNVVERREAFRTDSVVRPLIAENLARKRPWYEGFARLMSAVNPANDKPFRDQLPFERKGLNDMAADPLVWDDEGERLLVTAVHEAIRVRLRQIADENKDNRTARENRWERFRERFRLSLVNAKQADEVRFALSDLFSRAGRVPALVSDWKSIMSHYADQRWRLTRDLALFALASYGGQKEKAEAGSETIEQS